MKLLATLNAGKDRLRAKHTAKEVDTLGRMRGGDALLALPGGSWGKCPRMVTLRRLGYQEPIDHTTTRMFSAGAMLWM